MGPASYVNRLNGEQSKKVAKFLILIPSAGNGSDVLVSIKYVLHVKDRLENSVYGFFLGKRVAFPVVEYYVKNA